MLSSSLATESRKSLRRLFWLPYSLQGGHREGGEEGEGGEGGEGGIPHDYTRS